MEVLTELEEPDLQELAEDHMELVETKEVESVTEVILLVLTE